MTFEHFDKMNCMSCLMCCVCWTTSIGGNRSNAMQSLILIFQRRKHEPVLGQATLYGVSLHSEQPSVPRDHLHAPPEKAHETVLEVNKTFLNKPKSLDLNRNVLCYYRYLSWKLIKDRCIYVGRRWGGGVDRHKVVRCKSVWLLRSDRFIAGSSIRSCLGLSQGKVGYRTDNGLGQGCSSL